MENEDEEYIDISHMRKMAEENPDGMLKLTSSLIENDNSLMSDELIRSQRFFAYSKKAINAMLSNKKIDAEIIDLIEKSLMEAKAADDVSVDKQNDYYGTDRVNYLAQILEEVKPGRVQELWGRTKLCYFPGERIQINRDTVPLNDEVIMEVFGKTFFTFPHIVTHATISDMKKRDGESVNRITVGLSYNGYTRNDLKGIIEIYRDGTARIQIAFP